MKQQNSNYPMNSPYINNGYRNQILKGSNFSIGLNENPSYYSQSTIQYSNRHNNKTIDNEYLSQSSTVLKNESNFVYSQSQKSQKNPIQNKKKSSRGQIQNNKRTSMQQAQLSTQILHQKIHYLEQQLQQLTRILQQQSKYSGHGSQDGYQQLAIENAQLTIRIQQLQQQKGKLSNLQKHYKYQYQSLLQEYQKQHGSNNQLKQKIIQLQSRLNLIQKQRKQNVSQSHISDKQNNNNSQLQRQNNRLNEQIQNLLQKMHNLNIQFNEQQNSKQQLMNQLNNQNYKIQSLNKQISDIQIEKLQLLQLNNYLKRQIDQINQISSQKQRQIQDKYIKQQIQKKFYYEQLQTQNGKLTHQLKTIKNKYNELNDKINNNNQKQQNSSRVIQYNLQSQIKILNEQLQQQKRKYSIIKKKYNQMLEGQQSKKSQLQIQNRRLTLQIRKLSSIIDQKNRQIDLIQSNLQEQIQKINSQKSIKQNQLVQNIQEQTQNKIKIIKEKNRQLQQDLYRTKQQFQNLQQIIQQKDHEISQKNRQISQKNRQIQEKNQEIQQKDQLVSQITQLQQRHNQLINQVQMFKRNQPQKRQQLTNQRQNIIKILQLSVKNLKIQIHQQNQQNNKLHSQIQRLEQQNDELSHKNTQIYQINVQLSKINKQVSQKNRQLSENNTQISLQNKQLSQKNTQICHQIRQLSQRIEQLSNLNKQHSISQQIKCQMCPQILLQFNKYKQLMQMKFQAMNQMCDDMKMQFTRNQLYLKQQINKDKNQYNFLIKKYDQHDKQYRLLMERLWQWQKVNAKNQHLKQNIQIRKISYSQHSAHSNNSKIDHPKHLSDIQYDLYLIKLQNSTLRSQIAMLQKQLSHKSRSPSSNKQIQQLKMFNDNLLNQNQQLKSHLNQIVNNKSVSFIGSQKSIKNQTIFQRYSNSYEMLSKSRAQEKALASAQLLINKLKKQNDNLIQAKRYLEDQLNRQIKKYNQLIKQYQIQKQRTKRQFQIYHKQQSQQPVYELFDRQKIPLQYIRHHPEHKKLQNEYIALKRAYLQLDLQYKKSKQWAQQQIQKMRIQNDFHKQRITQLQNVQSQKISSNIFSFNQLYQNKYSINNNHNISQKNNSLMDSGKIKRLQQRVIYLQRSVSDKVQQCTVLTKKYQDLMRNIYSHIPTPRNNIQQQSRNNIQKQNSLIKFDQKIIEKLKQIVDKKMIQLCITPREKYNIIQKTILLIQKFTQDLSDLKNNIQILKGQKKALMKQRNTLKQKIYQQNIQELNINKQSKNQNNSIQTNYNYNQYTSTGLNKIKILSGNKSVPKLLFNKNHQILPETQQQNQIYYKSNLNNVINQTLQLKNQRRNGLKKFQKQIQKLTIVN